MFVPVPRWDVWGRGSGAGGVGVGETRCLAPTLSSYSSASLIEIPLFVPGFWFLWMIWRLKDAFVLAPAWHERFRTRAEYPKRLSSGRKPTALKQVVKVLTCLCFSPQSVCSFGPDWLLGSCSWGFYIFPAKVFLTNYYYFKYVCIYACLLFRSKTLKLTRVQLTFCVMFDLHSWMCYCHTF